MRDVIQRLVRSSQTAPLPGYHIDLPVGIARRRRVSVPTQVTGYRYIPPKQTTQFDTPSGITTRYDVPVGNNGEEGEP